MPVIRRSNLLKNAGLSVPGLEVTEPVLDACRSDIEEFAGLHVLVRVEPSKGPVSEGSSDVREQACHVRVTVELYVGRAKL